MKLPPTMVFFTAAAAAAAPAPEAGWSAVPASSERPVAVALVVPSEPAEESIRLVGRPAAESSGPRPTAPRVFGVALPAPPARSDPSPAPAAIPARARWPDATGRIVEDSPPTSPAGAEAVRNPWIPRPRPTGPQRSAAFAFGGFIAGGAGGPVGIVNGRSVRRGDAIGDFVIERIVPTAVVLERAGALYVVPPGSRTTIMLRIP